MRKFPSEAEIARRLWACYDFPYGQACRTARKIGSFEEDDFRRAFLEWWDSGVIKTSPTIHGHTIASLQIQKPFFTDLNALLVLHWIRRDRTAAEASLTRPWFVDKWVPVLH
ncbi:MAG: hypothetical protein AB7N24_21940 [Dehalococcoidia bacterium]